jgi:hypothetical protein
MYRLTNNTVETDVAVLDGEVYLENYSSEHMLQNIFGLFFKKDSLHGELFRKFNFILQAAQSNLSCKNINFCR